jgi:hypothetical protein
VFHPYPSKRISEINKLRIPVSKLQTKRSPCDTHGTEKSVRQAENGTGANREKSVRHTWHREFRATCRDRHGGEPREVRATHRAEKRTCETHRPVRLRISGSELPPAFGIEAFRTNPMDKPCCRTTCLY